MALTHRSILTTRFPLPPPTQALQTQGGTFAYGKYFIHKGIFIGWCIWVIIAPPIGKYKQSLTTLPPHSPPPSESKPRGKGEWAGTDHGLISLFFLLMVLWLVGPTRSGTPACFVSGFFVMIDQFGKGGSKGTTGGVMSIINLVLWGLTLFLSAYEIIWAFTIWKKGGGPRELQVRLIFCETSYAWSALTIV